jgi:hypothetical protein
VARNAEQAQLVTTFTITGDEIAAHRPDVLLPTDPEFASEYAEAVSDGREIASLGSVALVAICRNAMPWLPQTLRLVEETGAMFRDWKAYIHENDSTDGTKDVLTAWHDGKQRVVSLNENGRPHLSHTIAPERTHALAEYRTACQEWVRSLSPQPGYTIVFDSDPWGGWSVDGVATSVAHIVRSRWYGLASYSWAEMAASAGPLAIHYDAFACRWGGWERRDQTWFHHWHPRVGGPVLEMNSAFGQLAVYETRWFLKGTYSGGDCEHVALHKSIAKQSHHSFGLNPSSRCVSFWTPRDGGLHGNH